ncbi:MAG: hypothetical protein ACK5MQ_15915 [Pikeienuella sp.]
MPEQPGQKYAFANLMRALAAGGGKKIRQWGDVLAAMRVGDLTVGSRTPVAGMPEWATPDVVRGGFATTTFAAGGKLRPHELRLARDLSLPDLGALRAGDVSRIRLALNNWHLSDEGLSRLREQAETGAFAARTPEETALLVVALLLESAPDAAEAILTEITPFFDRLSFYPIPAESAAGEGVFVRSVAQIRKRLASKKPRAEIVLQHHSLSRWIPLNDRLIDILSERGRPGWDLRAAKWLKDFENAKSLPMSRRWRRTDSPFQRCRWALVDLHGGKSLSPGKRADIDAIIARHRAKYGDVETRARHRKIQAGQDVRLWHDAVAKVVSARLKPLPPEIGITAPAVFSGPITPDEAIEGAPAAAALPKSIVRLVDMARMAPVAELIEERLIGAPEVLAEALPQLTALIYARGLPNEAEARVCASLYRAFRQRRSLLLLNLESQIRLEELPWAAALLERRKGGEDAQAVIRETLTELVRLSLTHFPHVIFPNPLIREMSALGEAAGLRIPFTGEIAADIFMGVFSQPFEKAAEISLRYYAGKLYARYYNLPDCDPPATGRSMDLSGICAKRAGVGSARNWSVAANGMIIEQQQIITSHNLAQLFTALDLGDLDHARMATDCFGWISRRQQVPSPDWRANLQMTKNTAFAWRQMIAFMSELEERAQLAVFDEIREIAAAQSPEYRRRIAPAIKGLGRALAGERPVDSSQVFLGWAQGRHPFAPAIPEKQTPAR